MRRVGEEMGQASHHARRVMSLRSDPGRLSLETLLTGTALWLALLYLMQEGAAVAGLNDELPGSTQPADGDAGLAATGRKPVRTGGSPEELSLDAPQTLSAEAESPVGGSAAGPVPEAGSGGMPVEQARSEAAAPAPSVLAQEGTMPGAVSLAAGSTPLPWLALPGRSAKQVQGAGPSVATEQAPLDGARPPASPGTPAFVPAAVAPPAVVPVPAPVAPPAVVPMPAAVAPPKVVPAVPVLRVLVRSDDSLVSRSVEGPAQALYAQSLGAITDAVIDLRDNPTPKVRVGAERELHVLALSVLDDAELVLDSSNVGLERATLSLGPEFNDIRLLVSDVIDLGLVAGGLARGQIQQSLVGLLDSLLQDAGGGGILELTTLAQVELKAPDTASERQLEIDLLAQAMQDSTVLLGNGNDRVTIDSGFRPLDGSGTGLLLDTPGLGTAEDGDTFLLRARALGLVNSLLDVGGGDDQVSITTWLEHPSPSQLERIAMLESALLLGEGDDLLTLQGAVIGSRIDPGGGNNAVRISGPVQESVLELRADSTTSVGLAEHDDSLAVSLPEDTVAALDLDLGSGDDLILLPGAGLRGSIDGGEGFDALRMTSAATATPLPVYVDAPGSGVIGTLRFGGMENLSLGDGNNHVTIGAGGNLSGVLEAGGGLDRLDYASWQEPVLVDLSRGEASGILGGIDGFEAVAGGSGDDWLIAAGDTVELDGGDGNDRFELDLSAPATGGMSDTPSWVVHGGAGRDRFVLAGMESIRLMASTGERALPVLADLDRSPAADGGIGLSDLLAWRRGGILLESGGEDDIDDLTPAGLEGMGQPRLLPIAPLDQLVSGMESRGGGTEQLAIATGDVGSRLVLLGSDRTVTAIAELPSLRSPIPGPDAVPISGATPGAMH